MSDKDPDRASAIVLPPTSHDVEMPLDRPLSGISLVNRAKYWVAKKEFEAYIAALQLKNRAIQEINRSAELREQYYARTLTRVARMEDLRKIEDEKITLELNRLLKTKDEEESSHEIRMLQHRLVKAELKIRVAETEQQLDRVNNPPEPEPVRSPAQRAKAEVDRINKEFSELKTQFVDAAKVVGEDEEETKQFLDAVELARRDKISQILETME